LLAEDGDRSDRSEWRALLRARLAGSVSEGLSGSPAGQGEGDAGAELARIAAFLDSSVSQGERDELAAKLADDAVARSDVASAAALLDSVQAEPMTVPPGLAAQAAGYLAAEPTRPRNSALASVFVVAGSRRPAMWSALAAVVLVVAAIPVVSMVWDWSETPPAINGAPVDRGIGVAPAGKAKEKDARSCDDVNDRASSAHQPPDRAADTAKVKANADHSGEPPSAADDPCRPESAEKHKTRRVPETAPH